MIKNYFKIALRTLSKNKVFTFINVAGLAVGMGICLFLVLLDHYALTFNHYHENSDRIYRVNDSIKQNDGNILNAAITPSPWGEAMRQEFPEIEEATRFLNSGAVAQYSDKILRQGVTYVDESVFRIFSYDFKYGSAVNALMGPNKIVMTEEMSVRFFADQNPVGETILIDNEPFEITGVLEKLHPQSSFSFNSLASFDSLDEEEFPTLNNWRTHNLYTYVLLQEDANVGALEAQFNEFIARNVGEEFADRYTPHLQNLEDIYLSSNLFAEHGQTLDIAYIYIFSIIGLLILIIACINFVNLATAQGLKRAREVGVRKVLGGSRKQLVFQFLTEAFILSVIAAGIGAMLVEFALPWFNNLADWSVEATYFSNPVYLTSIIGVVLLVSLFAGGYPAFYLSAARPVLALKGNQTGLKTRTSMKTVLVVSQFTVAVFMLVSAFVVGDQLNFLQNKDLGFNSSNVIVTGIPDGEGAGMETIRGELLSTPGIEKVAISSNIPGDQSGSKSEFYPEGIREESGILVNTYAIDSFFLDQFDIALLQGRDFTQEIYSDSSLAVIINEAAARDFGWENPIGKTISSSMEDDRLIYTVVGLVEDFHYETLHNSISPLVMRYQPSDYNFVSIRTNTLNSEALTTRVTNTLKELNNGLPVSYYFLEVDISSEYITENVIGEMLLYFTYLTLFIACLGLFGLVSFTVINRKKEIGIRKVLGASVSDILQNLSGRFLKLIVIGFLIGAPLAYFFLNQWLQSFAYSTSVTIETFLWAGFITLIISMLTISHQALKAARANPVNSLKSE